MSGPYPNNTPGSFVFVDRNMPHRQDTFSPSRSETPSPPKATPNTLHPRTSSGSNSTRGPSNRYRRDRERVHSNTPTDALLTLLINEEHEAKETRKLLHTALSQLDSTSNRLAQAESDGRLDSLQGIKFAQSVLDARNEATRAQQELGLYKMQLENAQREVQRAKEVVRTVEAQRDEAERDAAKARTLARRLKEERVMFVAREEGRREGFEEGLRQGRLIALAREEERMVGYRQMRRIADRPADETAYIEEEGDDAAYSDVVHSRDERRPAHDIRGRPLSIEGGTRGVYDTPRRPASADLANHSRSRSMNTPRAPEPTLPRTRHHRTASASTAETPRRAESTPPQHQHQYPPTPDLESELDRTIAPHPPFTIPEPLTYLPMPAPPPPPPILIPVPVPMPPPAPTQTDQGQRRMDTHVITRRTSSPDTRSPSSSTTGLSQLDLVTFPNPSGGSGSGRGRRGNGNGNGSNINGSGSGARGLDRDREGQRGRDRVRSLSAIPEDGGSVRSGQTPSQGSPNQAQAWNQTPSQNQSPRWASPGHDSGIGGLETPPQIVVSRPTTFHQQQPPRPASGLGLGLGLGSGDERSVDGWQWGANAAGNEARDSRRRGIPEQDRQTRRHPDQEASSRRQSGASQHSLHPSQGPYSRPNHHRRGSSAESFASVPGITIEPPSRPPSIGHSRPASASRPGFLSPNHVHDNLPPQDPQPTSTVQNTPTYPIPSPLIPFQFLHNNANNSHLNSNNSNNAHLPPGFVPNSTSPTPSPNNTFPFPAQPPTPRSPHLRLDGGGSPERQPYYPHSSPTENTVPIPIPVPTPTTPRQIYAYPSSPGPSTARQFDSQTGVGSAPHRYSTGASVNAGITPATLNRPLPGPGASNTHNYSHGNSSTHGNDTQSNTNTASRKNKSSLRKVPSATSLTSSTRSYSHYDPTTYLDPAYFPSEDDPLLDPATTLNTLANAASASTRLREAVSPRRAGVRLP